MKAKILLLLLPFATLAMAQTTNWQHVGDSVEYTYAKVGIDTSTPKEALEIKEGFVRGSGGHGCLRIQTDCGITAIGCDSWAYSHFDTNMPRFYFYKPIVIGNGEIAGGKNKNISLQTYNGSSYTTRMFVNNSNGYVGIGTSTPAYKLDINGKLHASDTIFTLALKAFGAQITHGLYAQSVNASSISSNTILAERIYPINSTITLHTNTLSVLGTIKTKEIIVNTTGADFVFEDDYNLRSLQEIKTYIQENHHLPEIPSAKEMLEEGMSVDKMVVKLLQKVEELTIYNIQLEERINRLESQQR